MNDTILMDLEDYKLVLSHSGKIEGLVGFCKIDELKSQFDDSFKNSLLKAKAVSIKLSFHPKQSIFIIKNCATQIIDLISTNSEVIFGTENTDIEDEEIIKYEIIVTGL